MILQLSHGMICFLATLWLICFFQTEIMSPKISYFGSSRSVRAERLEQVVAERLIIVDDEHLLIEVHRPLCDAKGPFRPSRGESTRTDVYLYPAGAIGEAARKYDGARSALIPAALSLSVICLR
jgi:hypothetical protein